MIALLCSVPLEAQRFMAAITAVEAVSLGSKTIYRGTIADQEVALCVGGMGKANAAHAATLLFTRYKPHSLIIFGVGGAYPSSGATVGDIALASEEIAGDEGVLTRDGFKGADFIGIPLVQTEEERFFNRFPASAPLLRAAREALSRSTACGNVRAGAFVTLSTCTGTSARLKELERLYHPLCENMEGAAAAQVAALHAVPWIEVRAVSNVVEDRDLKKWDIPRAAQAVQRAVELILPGLS